MEVASIRQINDYTVDIVFDNGKRIQLKDEQRKADQMRIWKEDLEARSQRIICFSKVLQTLGGVLMILAFIILIGVVGHGDFVSEMKMIDDWSTYDYIIHSVVATCIAAVGIGVYKFAENMI